ncbi:MAG TPA: response regulator, partial [Actinomycetales bacterium]
MAEAPPPQLSALVVDDEAPALSELAYLLGRDDRIGTVLTAGDATQALRQLEGTDVDVVFCDIKMPGLDGLDLARVLARFSRRPQVVFVTAYDQHAVDAFELQATDYVKKPVRPERLAQAIGRVVDGVEGG